MSEFKAIIERLRIHTLKGSIALLDLHVDALAHKVTQSDNADERWMLQVESEMLTEQKYKLLLLVALLERKQREDAGLPAFTPR